MKKRILAIMLALGMIFSLTACGGSKTTKDDDETKASGTEGGSYDVGIVFPTKDEPRWPKDQAILEADLKDAGISATTLYSQGSSNIELTNVQSLVEQGVKAIVICAQDATAAAAAAEYAHDAGVKVVCYDRLITDTDAVDYYVTFEMLKVGQKQGQYLIDTYKGKTGVPLYIYSGGVTDNNSFVFFAGAWSVLNQAVKDGQFVIANCENAEEYVGTVLDVDENHAELNDVMSTCTTNWDVNYAKSLAESNLIAADASMKGDVAILAPNDFTARAISDAFSDDADISSYVITGQDCEAASLGYIIQGKQSMTVWKDTTILGAQATDMLSDILAGKEPELSTTYNTGVADVPAYECETTVVDKSNYKLPVEAGFLDAADIDGYEK